MNSLTPKKILVIDDDPASLALIRARLEPQGYTRILTFSQPEPALQEIAAAPPDLIILDIMLEGHDGLALCRRITADYKHSMIPIIMITGSAPDSDDALRAAFDAGAIDFVSKPIRAEELIPRVQAALRLKQTHDRMREEIERRTRAEQEISAREHRFRAIAESTPDAVVLTDGDFKIIYWNSGAQKIYGYAENEVLGRDIIMLIPERDRARDKNGREQYLAQGTSRAILQTIETNNLRSDGTEFFSEVSTFAWREGDRAFFGAIIRDISERKQKEEEHKKTSAFLENVFATTGDGLIVTDATGVILRVNKKTADMLGYAPDELPGMHMAEFSCAQYNYARGEYPPLLNLFFEKGVVEGYTATYRKKDGTALHLEVNMTGLKNSAGEYIGAVASIRDISERISIEKKTREAKEFLENIFNTVEDGIVITDKEGFIIQVNRAFADIHGYTEQEIIGRHTGTFYPAEYEIETMPPHIQQVFLEGYIKNYETKRMRKDGTIIDIELSISILKDSEGDLKGMVASIRDITERKLNEQKRENLIGELQEALSKVKTLSGLLPICASCKRIRDDRGYWNQIEAYIRDRSDAEFSHGICPECKKKLYPEFCDDETDENNSAKF